VNGVLRKASKFIDSFVRYRHVSQITRRFGRRRRSGSSAGGRATAGLRRRNLPFVVVDGVSQPPPEIPSIGATNFTGGYAATEHLIRLGHRRIAVIGGPGQLQSGAPRPADRDLRVQRLPGDRRLRGAAPGRPERAG
jgi:hypothetical protein